MTQFMQSMMITFFKKTLIVHHWVWLYIDVKKEDERSAYIPLDMSFLVWKREEEKITKKEEEKMIPAICPTAVLVQSSLVWCAQHDVYVICQAQSINHTDDSHQSVRTASLTTSRTCWRRESVVVIIC